MRNIKYFVLLIGLFHEINPVLGQTSTPKEANNSYRQYWSQYLFFADDFYPFSDEDFSKDTWVIPNTKNQMLSILAYENSNFLINENYIKKEVDYLKYSASTCINNDFLYQGSDDYFAYTPEEVLYLDADKLPDTNQIELIAPHIKAMVINSYVSVNEKSLQELLNSLPEFPQLAYLEILKSEDQWELKRIDQIMESISLERIRFLYLPIANSNQLSIINENCANLKALQIVDSPVDNQVIPNPFLANSNKIEYLNLVLYTSLQGEEFEHLTNLRVFGFHNGNFDSYRTGGGISNELLNKMKHLKSLTLSLGYREPTLKLSNKYLEYLFILSPEYLTELEIKKTNQLKDLMVFVSNKNGAIISLKNTKSLQAIDFTNDAGNCTLLIKNKCNYLKTMYMDGDRSEIYSKKKIPDSTEIHLNYVSGYSLPKSRNATAAKTFIHQSK